MVDLKFDELVFEEAPPGPNSITDDYAIVNDLLHTFLIQKASEMFTVDFLAAHVLVGVLAQEQTRLLQEGQFGMDDRQLASRAYDLAEAMLWERALRLYRATRPK